MPSFSVQRASNFHVESEVVIASASILNWFWHLKLREYPLREQPWDYQIIVQHWYRKSQIQPTSFQLCILTVTMRGCQSILLLHLYHVFTIQFSAISSSCRALSTKGSYFVGERKELIVSKNATLEKLDCQGPSVFEFLLNC